LKKTNKNNSSTGENKKSTKKEVRPFVTQEKVSTFNVHLDNPKNEKFIGGEKKYVHTN